MQNKISRLNEEMTCEKCKIKFPRKSGNQKYCLPCSIAYNAEKRRKKYIEKYTYSEKNSGNKI